MAKETTAEHTPESLNHLAAELETYAAALKAAAIMLELEPAIPSVLVRFESSRGVGFEYVRTWVNAARQSASEARLEAFKGARNGLPGVQPEPAKRTRKSDTSPK